MPTKKTDVTKTKGTSKSRKNTTKKTTTEKAIAAKAQSRSTSRNTTTKPRAGDVIVIDSAQVGSPAREGEIVQVIEGDVSVSYRVKWADGHETLITPGASTCWGGVSWLRQWLSRSPSLHRSEQLAVLVRTRTSTDNLGACAPSRGDGASRGSSPRSAGFALE